MFHIMLQEFQRTGSDVVVRVELISVWPPGLAANASFKPGLACPSRASYFPLVLHALATLRLFFNYGVAAAFGRVIFVNQGFHL